LRDDGTIDYEALPRFIAMADQSALADPEHITYYGFIRREDLFQPAFKNVDPYDLNKPVPVFADDLRTQVGVYVVPEGFIPNGQPVPHHEKVQLINPETGEVVTEQPVPADVEHAFEVEAPK
jgi:hypothetical protein